MTRRARHTIAAVTLAIAAGLGGCSAPVQSAQELAAAPDMTVILADKPAELLSAYGLFSDAAALDPVDRVIGYDLINPLFSDHAAKTRLVFVPAGQTADYTGQDILALPVGSVLIKSFGYQETGRIETRLLIHKADGWAAYPYVWNQDHSEARYAPIGAKRDIEITAPDGDVLNFTYAVPNQNQCKTCHQSGDAIVPIGPRARNLGASQIEIWTEAGILSGAPVSFASVPSILQAQGTTASRARAYLDINCAHCHKSDGAASNSGLWLTWEEDSSVKLGIGKHPTAAGRGAGQLKSIINAGLSGESILSFRMASAEPGVAMPELGRRIVDEDGVNLINQWIDELPSD